MYAYLKNEQIEFRGAKLKDGFDQYLGEFESGSDEYKFPKLENGEIVVDTEARDLYIQSQQPKEPTYREKRAIDYKKELSPEGNFETSTGDMIDALVSHIYGDTEKLDLLKGKIDTIKGRYPKP
jgi:hypothetical protein